MKHIKESKNNLLQLNEDCLRLIFEKLTLKDQLNLLTIDTRIALIIANIWSCKYEQCIDFCKENYFGQIQPRAEYELFDILSKRTKQLLNLNVRQLNMCYNSKFKFSQTTTLTICETYDSVTRSTEFKKNLTEILPKLKILEFKNTYISIAHISNLSYLQRLSLINVTISGNANSLMTLLADLTQLQHFSFLPLKYDDIRSYNLHAVLKCHALQTLELTANEMSLIIADIAQLTNLQNLTIFCRESINSCSEHHFILSKLNAIPTKHITAVTLQCQFDSLVLRALKLMTFTRKFCWHSYLHVEYIGQTLHWQAYDSKLTSKVLDILASYEDLEHLDLRENCHFNEQHFEQILKLVEGQQKRRKQLLVFLERDIKSHEELQLHETYKGLCGFLKFELIDKIH